MSSSQARLISLAQDGRVDAIKEILATDDAPVLEFVDEAGLSPLMYAAQVEGNAEVVEALLDGEKRQAEINYQSPKDGATALHIAAFFGALDCIDVLIRRGADVTLRDHSGKAVTDLTETHSESSSDAKAVQAAIYSAQAALANPRAQTPEEEREATAAAATEAHASRSPAAGEARETLSEASAALFAAVASNDVTGVVKAIEDGADVEATNENGFTSLHLASAAGFWDIVRYLVNESQADVDAQHVTSGNTTALLEALSHGQSEVAEWLVAETSASLELKNAAGESAQTIEPKEKLTREQVDELLASALKIREKNQRDEAAEEAAEATEQGAEETSNAAADEDATAPSEEPTEESPADAEPEEDAPQDSPEAKEEESEEKYPAAQEEPQTGGEEPEDAQSARPTTRDNAEEQQQQSRPASQQQQQGESAAPSTAASVQPSTAASTTATGTRPPPSFDARDARAFLELPLPQALALVIQKYKSTCVDFNVPVQGYIITAVQNIAYPGQALLLSGASAGLGNPERLNDSSFYPLLEVFAYSYPTCPLQLLDLSYNHLGRVSAQGLSMLLQACHSIQSLDLSGNNLDRQAGEILADVLCDPTCSIVKLNLHTNPLGPYAVAKFAQVLQVNTKLQELNLGNVECETLALMKIGTALQSNKTLKRLNLDSPLLYSCQEETTIHLARSLALNTSLISLSLKGHSLTDDGARWLAEYLLPNAYLVDLNLARNKLTTTGVKGFVKSIAHRPVECLINFDGNILTGQTFHDITEEMESVRMNRARNTIVWTSKQDRHTLRAKAPL